jgi:hypothetical protein
MIARPGEADDLDFVLRDTLRSDCAPQCEGAHIWSVLRTRIESGSQPAAPHLSASTPDRGALYAWPVRYYVVSLMPVVS